MQELEAELLGNLISDVLESPNDERVIAHVAGEVRSLCRKFPVYG
jgi:glycine hydroxymethyltransferase